LGKPAKNMKFEIPKMVVSSSRRGTGANARRMFMTDADRPLVELLVLASKADPSDRIQWRDPIAAYGSAGIGAVAPWLVDPALAAFAIRVIARAGADGERETAQATLRQARRRLDPRLRADADWALSMLKVGPQPVVAVARRVPLTTPRPTTARMSTRPRSRSPRAGLAAQ
jgi:hypothetical protein